MHDSFEDDQVNTLLRFMVKVKIINSLNLLAIVNVVEFGLDYTCRKIENPI